MPQPNKICRVLFIDGVDTREDGLPWPVSRYIFADPAGDPNEPWLWDGPFPEPEEPTT